MYTCIEKTEYSSAIWKTIVLLTRVIVSLFIAFSFQSFVDDWFYGQLIVLPVYLFILIVIFWPRSWLTCEEIQWIRSFALPSKALRNG